MLNPTDVATRKGIKPNEGIHENQKGAQQRKNGKIHANSKETQRNSICAKNEKTKQKTHERTSKTTMR